MICFLTWAAGPATAPPRPSSPRRTLPASSAPGGRGPWLRVTRCLAAAGRTSVYGFSILLCGALTAQAAVDHSAWNKLLHRYVNDEGRVNYRAALSDSDSTLLEYLTVLVEAQPELLETKRDRLAFWINAYNACVFKGVLNHYPLKSVKDVPGFFDKIRYVVAGEELTLNQIEAKGRALGDWRIHVGVVCASASCPVLRNEAYVPERLNEQLAEQMKRFLANPRTGLRLEGSTLRVSSIFKWYAKDFVPGRMTAAALLAVLEPYLDPKLVTTLRGQARALKFLDYDWSLNERSAP